MLVPVKHLEETQVRMNSQKRTRASRDYTGSQFGELVVLTPTVKRMVDVLCTCGAERRVDIYNVLSGKTRSCGHTRLVALPQIGDTIGEWHVDAYDDKTHRATVTCSCGKTQDVYVYSILSGDSMSCGHARRNNGRERARLRKTWQRMIERCHSPSYFEAHLYGGRGIYVCDEWRYNQEAFIEWSLANGYTDRSLKLQIDRIDNDGPYSPDNCRWVTAEENSNNKRNNVFLKAFGERKTLAQWSRDDRCVVTYATLWYRVKDSRATPEEMLTLPRIPRAA